MNFFLGQTFAQAPSDTLKMDELKRLSLDELMNVEIEVFSVSKGPEKLTEVASAIQVVTSEDIHRSTATRLPEALRLSPNLQMAQFNSYAWMASARGFNAFFSNKLLAMIDGRTIYSPLFAGVYWDVQNVLLEDVERIEVVSGPGGSLWGANAVNGVINVLTKSAKSTPGLYASVTAGTHLRNLGAVRYGDTIGSNFFYRVYGQCQYYNNTFLKDGKDNTDNWELANGGFRMDWYPSQASNFSLQGNFYGGAQYTMPATSTLDGQNVIAKWSYAFSDKSNLIVQAYYDRTWRRDIPSTFSDQLETYDVDFQHRFPIAKRHTVLWGGAYRFMHDESQHSTVIVGFVPEEKDLYLLSGFVQDEIRIVEDKLRLTVGTKLLHNNYTGLEVQPSARLAWIPNEKHTVWSAVSRAVRTPSRIDVDYYIPTYPLPSNVPSVAGGPNFKSEEIVACELGYRVQPTTRMSVSLATFYNQYDNLFSVEALPGTLTYQIQNGIEGDSRGVEVSGAFQILKNWRVRPGYTYFFKELREKPGHKFDFSGLGNDPEHYAFLHSILNLPWNFQFDVTMHYVSMLPKPEIPEYFSFNTRIAWEYKQWGVSINGQNILEEAHTEVGTEIPRNFYGRIICRF